MISVSIVIYEWPVMVPETTRCLARQDSDKKKKRQVCQKPVITAIIQFDLICIIKVRYCVAVEATAIPCYYQIQYVTYRTNTHSRKNLAHSS